MIISLIGMSGIGKTYWSKLLEKRGFKRFSCDDMIELKIKKILKKKGYSGINDVAKWMGQPYEKQYPKTSKQYLRAESESMMDILESLKDYSDKDNIVVDTTGSVIYIELKILRQLSKNTKIIYLRANQSHEKEMFNQYIKDPKPVIWGNLFRQKNNETQKEALKRCYPKLLAFRAKQYERFSNIIADYKQIHSPQFSIDKLLKAIF